MPNASAILANLATIANDAFPFAVGWHLISALTLVALLTRWHPSNRVAATLLSLPLASVSAAAWYFGNPFNGAVFAVAALGLGLLAARGNANTITIASRTSVAIGFALFAFAWVYPHFLVGRSPVAYLYGAPLGIIPCPTLALLVAATLAGGGLVGGPWRIVLASLATFYAVFGMARLGVVLDVGLLVGAVALFAQHGSGRRGQHLSMAA